MIVVTFNKLGMPVGDEGNELVQFLRRLVRIPDHVSIEYSDWRKVPIQNKKDILNLQFILMKQSRLKNGSYIAWEEKKAWRGSLKARAYDPSLTVDQIISQEVKNDKRLNPTQFKKLVSSWFTPKFQRACDAKRLSCSKMKEPHASGTKSFARHSHEMATKNNGVYPTRGELYIKTHTQKDGTIVDDKAAHVVASLNDIANDSTITPNDLHDFTKDDYSRVKGPEKRGYIRLVGRMPATKSSGASLTDLQTIDQLKNVVGAMVVIIQEHIPNANLSSVLNNMNIQVPAIGSLVHNNSLSNDDISSSRIHNDNV
ncbi:uncharacterized protein LOC143572995 [Bidens hawaiensis]|uniref:uncharacterized protein LOC143572995 n=1 Tax=Bidens hawaiensis TaxID=980011 RepID=UPI00404A28E0